MICEVGKHEYPLPRDFHDMFNAPLLETGPRDQMGYTIPLMRLSPSEYADLRREAREERADLIAMPRYYCISMREFYLHPAPDKPYIVYFQYLPHPKVW